jgi:cytochrome c5
MLGKFGFILTGVFASAVVVFSAGTQAGEVGRAAAQDAQLPEQLLQKNCQGCHDLRPIQTSAMDAEGWRKTIAAMIEDNGAEIAESDIPPLVKYLAQNHGPLPDGPGKNILLNTCTMCHDLGRIKTGRRSGEEWEETLISMLNEGAPLSEAEFPVIHSYLSRHFGVE